MQQTTNYQMAKPEYTDAADIAPISGNMDTIDTALNKARLRDADLFSENQSYTIGSYVIYQDALYRTPTGASAGAWDASKWEQVSVMERLRENERTASRATIGVTQLRSAYPEGYDETETYHAGDLCLHDVLRRCIATTTGEWDSSAWEVVTFEEVFERKSTWELFGTETADGTSRTMRVNMPAGVNGIFVQIRLATGATNSEFGVVVKATARHGVGDIANYISTSGARYGLCRYTRDGGLYTGYLTQPMSSLQASPNLTMRGDNFTLDSADIDYIEFRTNDMSAVIPSGSKFEIYIRK